jgi:hypothetical protein
MKKAAAASALPLDVELNQAKKTRPLMLWRLRTGFSAWKLTDSMP